MLLAPVESMKRALLISKDPLFAWALDKKLSSNEFRLEHVYTIPEAKLRLNRFHYNAVFFDDIPADEIDNMRESITRDSMLFLFSDSSRDDAKGVPDVICVPKETALAETVPSLHKIFSV